MLQLFRNILGSIVTIFYARNKRYVCIFLSAWLWFVIIAGRSFFVCVFFPFRFHLGRVITTQHTSRFYIMTENQSL